MDLLNTLTTAMRWTDLDAYGHLNNANFFNFMTEARAVLFKSALAIKDHCQLVTVHVSCDYKMPFFYPDEIIIHQYCQAIGNSSVTLTYEFYSTQQPNVLHAQGLAKMVAVNPRKQKAMRLPEELIALLMPSKN